MHQQSSSSHKLSQVCFVFCCSIFLLNKSKRGLATLGFKRGLSSTRSMVGFRRVGVLRNTERPSRGLLCKTTWKPFSTVEGSIFFCKNQQVPTQPINSSSSLIEGGHFHWIPTGRVWLDQTEEGKGRWRTKEATRYKGGGVFQLLKLPLHQTDSCLQGLSVPHFSWNPAILEEGVTTLIFKWTCFSVNAMKDRGRWRNCHKLVETEDTW